MKRLMGMHRSPLSATTLRRALALLLLIGLLGTACSSDPEGSSGSTNGPDATDEPGQIRDGDGDGDGEEDQSSQGEPSAMTVRMDDAESAGIETEIIIELGDSTDGRTDQVAPRETTLDGTELSNADSALLLSRLPELDPDSGDQVDFNRPPATRPRPRPGATVDQSFPPEALDGTAPSTESGPLEVLRFQPEGPVDLAPFISVTFDQPMIGLGTVDAVEAADVPITISPEMPGRFVWLGTRTVRFEYEPGAIDRIPAATNYVVEIAAGTESATGSTLAEPVQFEFSTPAASVTQVSPMSDSLSTTPVFLIEFNQRVNPASILEVTTLNINGSSTPIRLANDEEVAEDSAISSRTEQLLADRWIAFRPTEELPTDASIEVIVGPHIPSAEGPETNDETSRHSGRTYGPLRVLEARCGWNDRCVPGQPFQIEMTNPLDVEAFTADQIRIDPPIPSARIGVSGRTITVQGLSKGQTTYDITINASLTDIYDQQLGDDETVSIKVGDAPSALFQPGRQLVTVDPIVADDNLNVTSINNDTLAVQVFEVDPNEDWIPYIENGWRLTRQEWSPDWPKLDERIIQTNGQDNEFTETAINLTNELDVTGHVVVLVAPPRTSDDEWQNQPFVVWVQRTTIGIDAATDNQSAVVWVTDLRSGEALAGADVSLNGGGTESTDSSGLAELTLGRDQNNLTVTHDGQTALVGEFWANFWERTDQLRWFVLDDRGLYKPGETVNLKGWVRRSDSDTPSDLSLPDGGTVRWNAQDAFGNPIGDGTVELSRLGGFDIELELPQDITLGSAGIQFSTDAFSGGIDANGTWHEIRVQEFRRPDFEVTTDLATTEPHFAGDTLTIDATAEYFAGGPIAGSAIDWQVTGRTTSYSPPNWPDFNFGIWTPWWLDFDFGLGDVGFGGGFGGQGTTEQWATTTDAAGGHGLAVMVNTEGKPRPVTITAHATVVDVNRQPISSSTNALIHPADVYVGLRGSRTFVSAGETFDIDTIVTDLDGDLVVGSDVLVTSTLLEWRFEGGSWVEIPTLDETCEVTSIDGPLTCPFTPSKGGRYRITATVTDELGRNNLTELTRWVSGGVRPQSRRVDLEQLTLVPDGETWQPGDVAEILVQSPFVDAHGLAVVSRSGIDRVQTFAFDADGTAVLRIPITDGDIPGVGVQIEVAGTAPRSNGGGQDDLPVRPAFAAGQITLSVPPDSRALTVDVAPRQARLQPGEDTQVDVAIADPDGNPVAGAEMTVIVVDEAVLSLTGYQLGDPLDAFYPTNGGSVQNWRGRATLLLSDPGIDALDTGGDNSDALADEGSADFALESDAASADLAAPQAGAAQRSAINAPELAFTGENDGGDAGQPAIDLRTNFEALAVFEPGVTTDADGRATIDVPLPDSLTRYRVMVIATADATDAGTGESNITARLPVTVRPTPPRFANFGDRFEFPVVVQNATDEDLDVDVAFRSTNLRVEGRNGTTVTVPANDRVEVRFEVSADEAGTARYQVGASTGSFADAAEGSFPVYTPATAEAFATYGVVDSGSIAQPFTEPRDVFPQFGGLEISTSSTAVSALTDAVIYLKDYRYESSDAFASRIIAIVSLEDILTAFESDQLPTSEALRSTLNNDIDRLASMQNGDGGFPSWVRGRESIPYNSVQATHALVLARDEGLVVGDETLNNALWYLANIEEHIPSWYSPSTRRAIGAYALHVRFLAGDRDVDKATRVFNESDGDQLDVAAWLWPVLADTDLDNEIERLFNNRVTETPNAATFATSYGEQAWVLLHSDRRTDAIVLDSFLRMRPDSDLVLKTVNGLLAARSNRGYWRNVQENSFVLLAGSAYFDQFESVDPDFIARAWLGDTYAAEHAYEGRSTDQNATLVPMSFVVEAGDTDIVVAKDGDGGRLYYRLGLRYAPTDFELEPRDQGFVVQRQYEAIDDEADVVQNADGSWTVKAGARVRVRLTMVADSRRTHVALIDPMPAGFEAVNPALATSEPIPQADPSESFQSRYWWYQWFDHQNLRDDRAEAFSTWLGAGAYEYTYVTRATTPGTFVVPPARAEQIYEPEVFGRTSNTTVTITD